MSDEQIQTLTKRASKLRPIADVDTPQIPLWHDRVRGLPNPMARSALFTVGNQSEPRHFYKTHRPIQALSGYCIYLRGEELRQDDEDCFLQLVHLARDQPLSERVEFTAYSILKELGWKRSAEGYKRLKTVVDRLQGASLRIVSDHAAESGFQGALVRKFMWQSETGDTLGRWVVWLEPEIVKLFGSTSYTQVLWDQRLRMRSTLAKYLHSYYATHQVPHAIKVETLYRLSGSRTARLADFRKSLRLALAELQVQSFLDNWVIDKADLVHVTRSPKARQQLSDETK